MSTRVNWADAVDEDTSVEEDKVHALVATMREKLRPGNLLKSRALTTGMAIHTSTLDTATCEKAFETLKVDVPPELDLVYYDGSFYVHLNATFYNS